MAMPMAVAMSIPVGLTQVLHNHCIVSNIRYITLIYVVVIASVILNSITSAICKIASRCRKVLCSFTSSSYFA